MRRCGFAAAETIYNGPLPAWRCDQAPGLVFADSLESYVANRRRFPQTRNGLRLRPAGIASRFGIRAERSDDIVAALLRERVEEWHASFHVRPQDYGGRSWRDLVETVLAQTQRIEERSGARVRTFDVGGGKRPQEFDAAVASGDFAWLDEAVSAHLPHVCAIYCEPGQALVTACEALVAPVLEVRRSSGSVREIVVDAGYPDLPQIQTFPHRLFLLREGTVTAMPGGKGRILGRTCLEYDIVACDVDTTMCDTSCALVIADAGAYDASMRFPFALGTYWE